MGDQPGEAWKDCVLEQVPVPAPPAAPLNLPVVPAPGPTEVHSDSCVL